MFVCNTVIRTVSLYTININNDYTMYRTVKNIGSKKRWRIRTAGSLAKKLWRIEVHV